MVTLDLLHAGCGCSMLLAALLFSSVATAADETTGLPDATYPVILSGSRLDELLGKEIARIRLFAFRQGVMQPIPLQIDQRDSHGNWVWSDILKQVPMHSMSDDVERDRELSHRYGRTYDDEDPEGVPVLDDNDSLVFMAKDMGERVANAAGQLKNAAITLEIVTTDPASGVRAWAYAAYYASDPPPLSPVRYVHYEPAARTVISPVYAITFSGDHVGVIEQLTVAGTTLMDRTRFRGWLRLGGEHFGKSFKFTENDINGYVYGYINGPVRVVRRTVASLRFGLLLSSSAVRCDQLFYPYHSEIPVRLPANFLVHSALLLVAADYHNSPFRRAYTNASSEPVPLRDTSSDKNLLEGADGVRWVALAGDRASVVSTLTVPETIKPFIRVTPWLFYNRRRADPPETYVGTEPGSGYLIETRRGLPRGEHLLTGIYLYLPRAFQMRDARQIFELATPKLACGITNPAHTRKDSTLLPRPGLVSGRE